VVDFARTALRAALKAFGKDWDYYAPGQDEPAATITGVFNQAHEVVELEGEVPVNTTAPSMLAALAGANVGPGLKPFPAGLAPEKGGRFLVDGVLYSIVDRHPDGQGGMLLLLHEVTA